MIETQRYFLRNVDDMTQLRQDFFRYQSHHTNEFSKVLGRTSSHFALDVYVGYRVTILLDQVSAESPIFQLCTVSFSGNTSDLASFKIKQLPNITSISLRPFTEEEPPRLEEPASLIATLGPNIIIGEE